MKQESIDISNLWKDVGRPSNGIMFYMKKVSQYRYKSFLQKSQAETESAQERKEKLHDDQVNKYTIIF